MLTVIGAGLPRTGTSSLKAALERLGFGPCYHMFELMRHPEHADRWRRVTAAESAPSDRAEWDRVFEGYRAAVDFPASIYWRQLADAYPEAKVVLTVRDPRRWHASTQNAFTSLRGSDTTQIEMTAMPAPMRDLADLMPSMGQQVEKVLGQRWDPREPMDQDRAVEVFQRHTDKVRDALPSDRLLVFEASQGLGAVV